MREREIEGSDDRGLCHLGDVQDEAVRIAGLRRLVRYMQWSRGRESIVVAQYRAAFPVVLGYKESLQKLNPCLGDKDAWAKYVCENPQVAELKEVVCLVLGFLLSETECERHFASEKRQFQNRPRLGSTTRFAGLKVMIDGLRFDELICNDQPVCCFWQRVQDQYAKMFGTKRLADVKVRKDKVEDGLAKVKAQPSNPRKRNGKDTVATFKRRRIDAVFGSASRLPLPADTVFGSPSVRKALLEQQRL